MMGESGFLAPLMLALVLLGLLAGLPTPLVLAGGALLGLLVGQLLGVYDIVLMGDLAGQLKTLLENEVLLAIPLLALSGTLLQDTSAFCALRQRLAGLIVPASDALLAMSGGGGGNQKSRAVSALLERAIPASPFLVLLADLIGKASHDAQAPIDAPSLMSAMIVPGLCLAFLVGVARNDEAAIEGEAQTTISHWHAMLAGLAAISIPAIILFGLASPAEAGAVGVGLSLGLGILAKELRLDRLGDPLDRALRRSAAVYAALIAGAAFMLVFQGIGGAVIVDSLLSALPDDNVLSLLLALAVLLALLGLLIEPLSLAILFIPLAGPLLLAKGISPMLLGAAFILAPMSGLALKMSLRQRILLPLTQGVAFAVAIFWIGLQPADKPRPTVDAPAQLEKHEDVFIPGNASDSLPQGEHEDRGYAPPSEGE
ncbi:MAG: TRAP transporter large permease subunit [Alphaproteobacteria bacterium]|nr:TRAP transporter large permease subunit [Alphaproteobacteria bacterium]